MKTVAVIGGGISGIAAALKIKESEGVDFQLFESASRLGGVLETVYDNNYLIEAGADNFATLLPHALKLSRKWNVSEKLIQPQPNDRRAFVLGDNKLHPIPVGFSLMQPTLVRPILTSGVLSWRGKMRLLGEFMVPKRTGEDDESLESFATRRLGKEAFENLVEPIVCGIFTADPAKLSMRAAMPQFHAMEAKHGSLMKAHWAAMKSDAAAAAKKASGARYDQFMAPEKGMSDWVTGLVSALPSENIHLDTKVASLKFDHGKWNIESKSTVASFDGVVLATPAGASAQLLSDISRSAATKVGGIEYASSVVAAVVVKRAEVKGRIDGFGMIVPSKAGRASLAISYTSNKYGGRVPDDEILLRVFMGGAANPERVDQAENVLMELALAEIRELLQWTGKKPAWSRIIYWPKAMPQYNLGHLDRLQGLKVDLERWPTLQLCGAAYSGVGIPQCVRSGEEAAEAVLENLNDESKP